jgi:hypothetical protein
MKRTSIISLMVLVILSLSGCSLMLDGTHSRTYVSTDGWVDCYNCGYTYHYVSPPPPPRHVIHHPSPPPPKKHWNGGHLPKPNYRNGGHRPPQQGFKGGHNRSPMLHKGSRRL